MSIKLALELWFKAQEDGGGTFGRRSEKEYDGRGYVIGGVCEPLVLVKEARPIGAIEKIAEWLDKTNSTYVGSWVDDREQLVYIDGCDIRYNREDAIALGKLFNQIAIWDIDEGKEIRLEQETEGAEKTG